MCLLRYNLISISIFHKRACLLAKNVLLLLLFYIVIIHLIDDQAEQTYSKNLHLIQMHLTDSSLSNVLNWILSFSICDTSRIVKRHSKFKQLKLWPH